MDDAAGNLATLRTHPPEQSGYGISGKYYMAENGKSVYIDLRWQLRDFRQYVPFFEVTEGGEVRDVFTPVREGAL